jgi:crotonobetainyl-CoA:carnitine CoA-transferase CaiB-like acyl-CoA transferase
MERRHGCEGEGALVTALAGVTVVEFGSYAAGPAIGKYLGNFGARVIHVESMKRPDGFRLQYPPYKDHSVGINRSGCFAIFNDSKQGVTIDLKHSGGIELVYRLIERIDIVIENMRPGVIAKLGLDYASLAARNARLIMLSTSNLGQTGPRATHPGFGTQLSSLSGFTELIGTPDGPPHPLYGPYIDLVAVAYGGAAVLAALDRQRRTGEGAFIDLAQYETGLQFVAPALLDYAVNGVVARRKGNRDAVAVPHGCYPCAEDRWIVISCWDDEEWRRLAELVDQGAPASVINAGRLATASGRRAHESWLNERLAEWTRGHDAGELTARLRAARIHAAVVNTMRDLYEDPQLAARGVWQRYDHPELGPLNYRMVSYQLSETPGRVSSAAPCLGQHNEEVFRSWFGLSADEYDILSADGVFS